MAALVPPELVISDVVMPGMSGIDLAIQMREAIDDCAVILFSGSRRRLTCWHRRGWTGMNLCC